MKPEFVRDLIREANRNRLNSTEVSSFIDFSAGMLTFSPEATADELLDIWKQSFEQ